ncbi:hypothetical protein K438DRAFT_155180 [Mycena galopus ATCC 62051]|nr:hypothetical protein K438DRAFT_155180 [Mycena galopus ATCC 62051]
MALESASQRPNFALFNPTQPRPEPPLQDHMNIQWGLDEIQSPIAGRKSSPGGPRPIDPPPVAQLRCTVDPRAIPGLDLVCRVDLFRIPDVPNLSRKWSYYARDGTRDRNEHPVYALFVTDYPPSEIEYCIGNHAILEDSKETHLLHRGNASQMVVMPNGSIVFAFPDLAVLQTGQYLLRYTLYDRASGHLLSKCFGQPFRVYGVNLYPGAQPATQLSRTLATLRVVGFGGKSR